MKCSSEKRENGQTVPCRNEGVWFHPRYAGLMCEACKKLFEKFFPNDWMKKN